MGPALVPPRTGTRSRFEATPRAVDPGPRRRGVLAMKYAAELRDEAKALYLQLGLERSVDAVRQALLERGLDVPSERELYRWKKEDAWDEALDELRALAARRNALAEVETLREEAARRHLQLGKLAQTRGGLRLAKAAPAELTIAEAQRLIDQGIRWGERRTRGAGRDCRGGGSAPCPRPGTGRRPRSVDRAAAGRKPVDREVVMSRRSRLPVLWALELAGAIADQAGSRRPPAHRRRALAVRPRPLRRVARA